MFKKEPSQEELEMCISECLDDTERGDAILQEEMQAALKASQMEQISKAVDDVVFNTSDKSK